MNSFERQLKPKSVLWCLLAVFGLAFLVRFLHNGAILLNPLYFNPRGGHLPYFLEAELIAAGNLLKGDQPFSLNSPLYPYILAALYQLIGVSEFYLLRLITIVIDSLTCAGVALLALRHFGLMAGGVAGIAAAFCGPMILYSAELTPVPFTLFFVVTSLILFDRAGRSIAYALSGLLLGLAIGTRPNLLLLAGLLAIAPVVSNRNAWFRSSVSVVLGVMIGIFPVTLANFMMSGEPVLLTVSGGHNFYIGHNAQASTGYVLPQALDGDIFANMKAQAEKVEGYSFSATEVSSYYFKKGIDYALAHPSEEFRRMWDRFLATLNGYEPMTYSNYYYQEEFSPILRYALHLGLLFPLAFIGVCSVSVRKQFHILAPIVATFATLLLFFVISRLRMPMVPFVLILFAAGVVQLKEWVVKRRVLRLVASGVVIVIVGWIGNRTTVPIDTSNEWNKAGAVLLQQERYDDARSAFQRAVAANENNANSYRNLILVSSKLGDSVGVQKYQERLGQLVR